MQHDPMSFATHALPSGLRIFFQHRPIPFTGSMLTVGGGSRHDPSGKEELMHLLEHLLSAGTQGMPKLSLIELERWLKAQRFQCGLGMTQLDFSAYEGKAATERFAPLLRFMHDLTRLPTLDSDLEKEREIIRREREEAMSAEERATENARRRAMFGGHRLATCGGWAEDDVLDGLTLDDARDAHARYYDPANMALIVVGGIDEDELLRVAERTFVPGDPNYVLPPRPEALTFGVPSTREYVQKKDGGRVAKVEVRYLWNLPPGDRMPLMLARNALSEFLLDRIRERLRATYSVDVHDAVFIDHQCFGIVTQVTPKKVDLARTIIEETVRDVAAVAAETDRVKDEYALALEFLELDVDETLDRAATAVQTAGRIRGIGDTLAVLRATRADDVARVVSTQLAPERAYVELVEE